LASTILMSLVLAGGIWFYASRRLLREDVLTDIPVQVRSAKGLSAQAMLKTLSRVKLRGPRDKLEDLRNRNVFVKITITPESLKGVSDSHEITYNISQEHFNLPKDVQIVKVEPAALKILVSPIQTRILKVNPVLAPLAPGYEAAHITPIPASVKVEGPQHVFEKYNLKSLDTFPIELNYDRANFIYRARLKNEFGGVELNVPESVFVNVELKRSFSKKVFKDLPVNVMFLSSASAPVPVKLTPAKLDKLEFQGPAESLKELRQEDIRLYVEIDDTVLEAINQEKPRKVEVKCNWPRILPDISVKLENFHVTVDRKKEGPK